MATLRGQMDEMSAVQQLQLLNDPEMCNNIQALMGDHRILSAIPNATRILSSLQEKVCNFENQSAQPVDTGQENNNMEIETL